MIRVRIRIFICIISRTSIGLRTIASCKNQFPCCLFSLAKVLLAGSFGFFLSAGELVYLLDNF